MKKLDNLFEALNQTEVSETDEVLKSLIAFQKIINSKVTNSTPDSIKLETIQTLASLAQKRMEGLNAWQISNLKKDLIKLFIMIIEISKVDFENRTKEELINSLSIKC